jgi:hypothetical protein
LPTPFTPSGKDADELALAQQALSVLLVRAHRPALREQRREEGQQREHVEGQHPALAARGMLVAHGQVDHDAVPRQDARMVGHEESRALVGHVVHSRGLHPPPHRVQELEEGQDRPQELRVVAELVHFLRVPGEVERAPGLGEAGPVEAGSARLHEARQRDEEAVAGLADVRLRLAGGRAPPPARLQGHDLRAPPHDAASTGRKAAWGWR